MKKINMMVASLICILMISGCTAGGKTAKDSPPAASVTQDVKEEKGGEKTAENESVIHLVTPDDSMERFLSEDVSVPELSAEAVISQLSKKNVIPPEVRAVHIENETVDGKSTVQLDLNDAFGKYIKGVGTTGEYMIMGSVCNTFLNTYDADQIKLTVEGQSLSTGHSSYDGYLVRYE